MKRYLAARRVEVPTTNGLERDRKRFPELVRNERVIPAGMASCAQGSPRDTCGPYRAGGSPALLGDFGKGGRSAGKRAYPDHGVAHRKRGGGWRVCPGH